MQAEPHAERPRFETAIRRIASAGAPLTSRLPAFPGSALLAAGFNLAFDNSGLAGLEPLFGKIIAIRVTDAGLCFRFSVTRAGFVACRFPDLAAVTISAGVAEFVQLALRRVDPDTLFFSRRLVIEGDTELGLLLRNRLDALDVAALLQSPPRPRAVLAALGTALLAHPARSQGPVQANSEAGPTAAATHAGGVESRAGMT